MPAAPAAGTTALAEVLYDAMMHPQSEGYKVVSFSQRNNTGWLCKSLTVCVHWAILSESGIDLSHLKHTRFTRWDDVNLSQHDYVLTDYLDDDSDFEDFGYDPDDDNDYETPESSSEDDGDSSGSEEDGEGGGLQNQRDDLMQELENSGHSEDEDHTCIDGMSVDQNEPGNHTPIDTKQIEDGHKSIAVPENNEATSGGTEQSQYDTVAVTEVASPTWIALVFYLYTGVISFTPLQSDVGDVERRLHIDKYQNDHPKRAPPCSAKSMYRLAKKLKHEGLKCQALNHLRAQLSERTIVTEIFSQFTSRHKEVQTMELDILAQHWATLKDSRLLAQKTEEF
ncbi:hypothetical protein CERSUDRAFT_96817 [Gelatoporia subvermispora B]|uniref:BTB domain-containing protein n=1 Tax=Ceriporiopsis subvermispora (strain B) TaxID=914234 RepID=M2PG16_CERS8|nr:hypothetical protein CERSUDRAFT_96817 [Gelatoporia subvermispora B]